MPPFNPAQQASLQAVQSQNQAFMQRQGFLAQQRAVAKGRKKAEREAASGPTLPPSIGGSFRGVRYMPPRRPPGS
jgi:hypothetical protein